MSTLVRSGTEDEWKMWKELRLRALQDSPESFGEKYADAAKKTDDDWKQKMAEVAGSDAGDTLFAIVDNHVVGMMYVFIRPEQNDTGGIGGLWVTPEARQKGIGKDLIRAALGWLTKKDIKRVSFWNNKSNPASSQFYERLGFIYSGIEKPLESNPNFIIGEMVKDLDVED